MNHSRLSLDGDSDMDTEHKNTNPEEVADMHQWAGMQAIMLIVDEPCARA